MQKEKRGDGRAERGETGGPRGKAEGWAKGSVVVPFRAGREST